MLLGFNGDVKIADFGLAKAKQRLTKTLTGMRKGDPSYMAPELARADALEQRLRMAMLAEPQLATLARRAARPQRRAA